MDRAWDTSGVDLGIDQEGEQWIEHGYIGGRLGGSPGGRLVERALNTVEDVRTCIIVYRL